MANFPCQDCTYLVKYTDSNGLNRMRRTCVGNGIMCVHQNSAFPCKRSNCRYWEHESSVNGISWCDKCWMTRDLDEEPILSCQACMIPVAFVPYTDEELDLLESRDDI